ncbi:MAG: TatD family hydrolase [Clostridia bacterium]|nr:TatD family hydrolase [Clostridia bacterium]
MFIDTHAHLGDERIICDIQNVLEQAKNAGVGKIVCVGYDLQSSQQAVELSEKYENVYACIGVHPHDAKTYTNQVEQKLIELAEHPKVLAIGEIGLDYFYDLSPREIQKQVFVRQIELAKRLHKKIVVHMREATQDTMEILEQNRANILGAIVHCFNGSKETLERVMKMGFYVSYGGAVTFKNANGILEAVKNTPMNRILLETDCPYMTPVPHRGQTNYPKYITLVAQKICELKNMDIKQLEEITTQNAKNFFGELDG